MKYTELIKHVKVASKQSKQDGIPSYFYRSCGKMELTYPNITLPDNDVTFRQLCQLADTGMIEFDGMSEIIIIK